MISETRDSFWSSPWAELLLYLIAAFVPWLLLEMQEQWRWSGHESRLWPLFTLSCFPVLAALLLLVLRPGRPAREPAPIEGLVLPGREPARLVLWGIAAFAVAALLVPIVAGYFRDLFFRPMCSVQSDQMPFIEMALRDFWRDSRFPYHKYEIAHWYQASVYPPFMLLQFTLPWWFGVDPRIYQAACLATLSACLFLHAGVCAAASSSRHARIGLIVPVLIPFALFFLPKFRDVLFVVQTGGVWMMCAMLALAIRTRSWLIAGVLLALCIVSRAWFLFAVPPLLVYTVANRDRMRWGIARFWGALTVTGLLIGLPFLLFDFEVFIHNTVKSYSLYQPIKIAENPEIVQGFGFTGLLHKLRIADVAMTAALFLQASLFIIAALRVRTERDVVRAMALNLMAFGAFAMIPYYYIFVPSLVLLAFAGPAATMNERIALEGLPRHFVRWLRTGIFVFFVTLLFVLIGAGMFARPTILKGTNAPLAGLVKLCHGFERSGWQQATTDDGHAVVDRHAYLVFNADFPRLSTLYVESSTGGVTEPIPVEFVLNGEPVGTYSLSPERKYTRISIPRKNLKYGGNELALHIGSRYGEPAFEDFSMLGLRFHDVRASD